MSYTWEELAESQDFEHGQRFVKLEDYQTLEEKVNKLTKAVKEGYDIIRSTSYTELEDGAVKMCGNEWPWIPRGLEFIKQGLEEYGVNCSKR